MGTKVEVGSHEVGAENEGHRSELVTLSDVELIEDMTKDEIATYCSSRFAKPIDKSKKLKSIKMQAIMWIKERLNMPSIQKEGENQAEAKPRVLKAEFVFNPANRRVFEASPLLLKNSDLIHCWIVDKNGKKL
jgi:hypothetical protein